MGRVLRWMIVRTWFRRIEMRFPFEWFVVSCNNFSSIFSQYLFCLLLHCYHFESAFDRSAFRVIYIYYFKLTIICMESHIEFPLTTFFVLSLMPCVELRPWGVAKFKSPEWGLIETLLACTRTTTTTKRNPMTATFEIRKAPPALRSRRRRGARKGKEIGSTKLEIQKRFRCLSWKTKQFELPPLSLRAFLSVRSRPAPPFTYRSGYSPSPHIYTV